jgi:Ras-related protein Rab-8A
MNDNLIKVIVIGDSMVGKTQLTIRFADGVFSTQVMSTIGVDFKVKELIIHSAKYKMQVWDTAGQEKFRTITQSYYRRARGVVIVFDWSSVDSFKHLSGWFDSLYETHTRGSIPVVLVGNKDDLEHQISDGEAEAIARQYGVELFSASAKDGRGVDELFERIAELVVDQTQAQAATTPTNADIQSIEKGKKTRKKGIC